MFPTIFSFCSLVSQTPGRAVSVPYQHWGKMAVEKRNKVQSRLKTAINQVSQLRMSILFSHSTLISFSFMHEMIFCKTFNGNNK